MSLRLFSSLTQPRTTQCMILRTLTTTPCLEKKLRREPKTVTKKSRIPYDKRFPITPKDVGESKPGGSKKFAEEIGRGYGRPQMTGYLDKYGRFHKVKEMEAELVVPDLTGFKLKPYVSYRVPEIVQSKFTARDLFNACYSGEVIDDYRQGKLKEPEEYLNKNKGVSS